MIYNGDSMNGVDKFFHCDECGEIMMPVPSGGVCPNGHGRIRPGITKEKLRDYRDKLREMNHKTTPIESKAAS